MKIDRNLNIIVPVDTDGRTLYVHAAPISEDAFEYNIGLLQAAHGKMYAGDTPNPANMKHARIWLKNAAKDEAERRGVEVSTVLDPIRNEIIRMANVCVPRADGGGYEVIPLHQAIERKLIGEDDSKAVENTLTFFTLNFHNMSAKTERALLYEIMRGLGATQTTPFTPTDFANSLRMSTAPGPSIEKGQASSIPS